VDVIPERIEQFLAEYIPSITVLEILLLFQKEPDKESSALDVSQICRMEVGSTETQLEYLLSAELLTVRELPGRRLYRYGPSTVGLAETVDELSKWYTSHRVGITTLIFSNPSALVRPPGVADRARGRRK